MDINGLMAALAATGAQLNATELHAAQLQRDNDQLRAQLAAQAPGDDAQTHSAADSTT